MYKKQKCFHQTTTQLLKTFLCPAVLLNISAGLSARERPKQPARRSVPAQYLSAPRSAHAPPIFSTPAHRSAHAHAVLIVTAPLRFPLRSNALIGCKRDVVVGRRNH